MDEINNPFYMEGNPGSWQMLGTCMNSDQRGADVSIWVGGLPKPIQVYFNGTNTVVEWGDGRKSKAGLNNEAWDDEKGVAMAIARRFIGRTDFENLIKNAHDQRQKTGEPVKVLVIQAVMPDNSQIWYPIVLPPDNRETIEPFLEQTKHAEFGFALGS